MMGMFIRKSTKKQNSSFNSHGYQILVHRRDQHEQRVRAVNTLLSNCAPAPCFFFVPILNIKQSTFCCSSPVTSLEFLSRLPSFCYTAFNILPATPLSAVHLYVYSTVFANYHDTWRILLTRTVRVWFPGGAKIFISALQLPIQSVLMVLSSGLNWPEHEPNYSSIFTAEIIKACSYIFHSPIRLNDLLLN
jgi:hypothetical protein